MAWKIEINGSDRDLAKFGYVRHDDAKELTAVAVAQRQCLASKHRISELGKAVTRGEKLAQAEANSIIENFLKTLPQDLSDLDIVAEGGESIASITLRVKE